jgi:hypothetical protein
MFFNHVQLFHVEWAILEQLIATYCYFFRLLLASKFGYLTPDLT